MQLCFSFLLVGISFWVKRHHFHKYSLKYCKSLGSLELTFEWKSSLFSLPEPIGFPHLWKNRYNITARLRKCNNNRNISENSFNIGKILSTIGYSLCRDSSQPIRSERISNLFIGKRCGSLRLWMWTGTNRLHIITIFLIAFCFLWWKVVLDPRSFVRKKRK